MTDSRNFGFGIETKTKMYGSFYNIKDLARDEYVFRGEYKTSGKSKFYINDMNEKELIRIEAKPFSGKKHVIIQNREEIGTFFHKSTSHDSTIEIFIGTEYYYAPSKRSYNYKFADSNGDFVFSINDKWGDSWDYLLEISDNINPLHALIVTIAVITLDREYTEKS